MIFKHKKLKYTLPAIVLSLILAPWYSVSAVGITDIAGCLVDPASCINGFVNGFQTLMLNGLVAAIGGAAGILDVWIRFQAYDLPIINVMWSFIKNFVNMFFILIMLVIAFGTIFDSSKYNAKALLLKLIIAALLINFSLVIGQTIIGVSDSISSLFLKQIGTYSNPSLGGATGAQLSGHLMDGLGVQKGLVNSGEGFLVAATAASIGNKIIVTTTFFIVALVLTLFTMLTAALFVLMRTPILWLLLMFSPVAWFASVLPQTKKISSMWWNYFLSWTFFTPVYIFFLMIGIGFINARAQLADLGLNFHANFLDQLFSASDIFFYVITLFIIGGGLFAAKKVGNFGSSGVLKAVGYAQGIAKAPYTKTRLGDIGRGIKEGLKSSLEETKERGLRGPLGALYGGRQASRLRQAGVAERFGGRRERGRREREFAGFANTEYQRLREDFDQGRIDINTLRTGATRNSETTPLGYAHRKILAELGESSPESNFETLQSLRNNPTQLNEYSNALSTGEYNNINPAELAAMASGEVYTDPTTGISRDYSEFRINNNFFQSRKKWFKDIASNAKRVSKLTQAQMDEAMNLFRGPTTQEGKAFLKDLQRYAPDLVEDYNSRNPAGRSPLPTLENMIKFQVAGGVKNTAGIVARLWTRVEFQRVLYDQLARRRAGRDRDRYITDMEDELIQAGDDGTKSGELAVINTLVTAGTRP